MFVVQSCSSLDIIRHVDIMLPSDVESDELMEFPLEADTQRHISGSVDLLILGKPICADTETDEDIRDVSTDEEVLRTLNDPDLSNFAGEKEKTERVRDRKLVLSQFLLFVLGLVLGGLFIAYLWTPGQLRELSEEVADQNLTIAKLEQDNKMEYTNYYYGFLFQKHMLL